MLLVKPDMLVPNITVTLVGQRDFPLVFENFAKINILCGKDSKAIRDVLDAVTDRGDNDPNTAKTFNLNYIDEVHDFIAGLDANEPCSPSGLGLAIIFGLENGYHHSQYHKVWRQINSDATCQWFITTQSYEFLQTMCQTVDLASLMFYRIEDVKGVLKVISVDGATLDSCVNEHGFEVR